MPNVLFLAWCLWELSSFCDLAMVKALTALVHHSTQRTSPGELLHSHDVVLIATAYLKQRKLFAKLRSVTCYMGSHSVTSHPTQINAPRLNPSKAGRYSIYLLRKDGRL